MAVGMASPGHMPFRFGLSRYRYHFGIDDGKDLQGLVSKGVTLSCPGYHLIVVPTIPTILTFECKISIPGCAGIS